MQAVATNVKLGFMHQGPHTPLTRDSFFSFFEVKRKKDLALL
jgi:hypothetical protein